MPKGLYGQVSKHELLKKIPNSKVLKLNIALSWIVVDSIIDDAHFSQVHNGHNQ